MDIAHLVVVKLLVLVTDMIRDVLQIVIRKLLVAVILNVVKTAQLIMVN